MPSRIARWKAKWLWLRYSSGFRWAHKPLCDRFHKDVLKFGNLHLCRSCTLLYTGLILMIPVVFIIRGDVLLYAFTSLYAVVLAGSFPQWYKSWNRSVRDFLRFGLGTLITMDIALMFHFPLVAVPGMIIMLFFWKYYFKKRGGRKAHSCDGCPELDAGGICSGYQFQAERIRLYEEKATELLYGGKNAMPPILTKKK